MPPALLRELFNQIAENNHLYLACHATTRHCCIVCRELDGTSYAEEVLVTKSELEEKKQRMSELETQASLVHNAWCPWHKYLVIRRTDPVSCTL